MKSVLVAVLILAIATSMAPSADAATRCTYECAGVRCCMDEFNAGDCIQVQSNPNFDVTNCPRGQLRSRPQCST
jgi:hypothetical protein